MFAAAYGAGTALAFLPALDWPGVIVPLALLALVPIGLFFLAFQRFLVEGVATSGLKG